MLRNIFELAKDVVSKNSIVFKVFLEEIFKLLLSHQILGFKTMFLLMSLLNHCFIEKQGGKKDLI